MYFSLSNVRVYDKRQTWEMYFVTVSDVYLVRVRGSDIARIPRTLSDVAVLFFNNFKLMNDGVTIGRCFALLRGNLTVPFLSELLLNSALFIRLSSTYRSHFSEGARGVHLLLSNTDFNMILHQQTDKRVYVQVDTDTAVNLRSAISKHGPFETISFSDS